MPRSDRTAALHVGEAVRIALRMIRVNKLRAFFTILGTVMGVTFLIAVITLIEGMNSYVETEVKSAIYGVNSIQLRRRPSMDTNEDQATRREWRRRQRITFADAEWLADRMETPGTVALSATNMSRVQGPRAREAANVLITGASASYFQVREMILETGRPFSEYEAGRGVPVTVIGKDVASTLFEDRNPLGQTVRILGTPYRVIGVLEKQGSLFGMSMDNVAIAPIRSGVDGFINNGFPGTVDELTYKVPHAGLMAPAKAELESWMRIRHRLRPDTPNDFELETAEESLAFWNKIRGILLVALPGLVGVSLVVGAVVIMNIMLVAVSERTREIGLRKSLGARRRDILLQFLVEAGTLSGAGGVLGILLGVLLAWTVAALSPMPATVAPWSVVLALVLGVGVGLGAGVYPAYRASRLDPIVALRAE
ncbi:MAG: ABC transporter permease [Gemmatimonadota bacterium]|nr:ABC transporter permease [Gemmatimonadota bacterium]